MSSSRIFAGGVIPFPNAAMRIASALPAKTSVVVNCSPWNELHVNNKWADIAAKNSGSRSGRSKVKIYLRKTIVCWIKSQHHFLSKKIIISDNNSSSSTWDKEFPYHDLFCVSAVVPSRERESWPNFYCHPAAKNNPENSILIKHPNILLTTAPGPSTLIQVTY